MSRLYLLIMSSKNADQNLHGVHGTLVGAVRGGLRAYECAKDMWFNSIHANAPGDAHHNTVALDPSVHEVRVLTPCRIIDFCVHVFVIYLVAIWSECQREFPEVLSQGTL